MDLPITIRSERQGDRERISAVVRRTYADVPHSDHREHSMVDRLRETDAYVPALSLLAELAGEAVGHVLLTKVRIVGHGATTAALALAPLSVVPEYRSRGIGARLVRTAHKRAAAHGFRMIIVVGNPSYYPRFGYERLKRYPITLPFDASDANCFILALAPGALDRVAGEIVYAPAWLDH